MTLLPPADPLSQVVFVHDYLQLVFGDTRLSLYGLTTITVDSVMLTLRETGFCDAVVSLLCEKVLNVSTDDGGSLHIQFESGTSMTVASSEHGPESWQLIAGSEAVVG
jgi:hypothetical protein